MLERLVTLRPQRVEGTEELELAAHVLDDEKGDLAVDAFGHDAAGDAVHVDRVPAGLKVRVGLAQRTYLVARLVLGGVGGAGLAPRRELGPPLGEDVAATLRDLVHGGG